MEKLLLMGFILLFPLNMMIGTISTYAKPHVQCMSQSEVKFQNEFRKLWQQLLQQRGKVEIYFTHYTNAIQLYDP